MPEYQWFTAAQVAQETGISVRRVRQIAKGTRIGVKVGRDWLFTAADLAAIRARNTRVGRPSRKRGSPGT